MTGVSTSTPRQVFEALPRKQLTFPGPSHLQKLERLSARLGGATMYAKREDLNSPLAGGGNKVRSPVLLPATARN